MTRIRNDGEAHAALEQTCCERNGIDCRVGQGRSCPEPVSAGPWPAALFLFILAACIALGAWWSMAATPIGE